MKNFLLRTERILTDIRGFLAIVFLAFLMLFFIATPGSHAQTADLSSMVTASTSTGGSDWQSKAEANGEEFKITEDHSYPVVIYNGKKFAKVTDKYLLSLEVEMLEGRLLKDGQYTYQLYKSKKGKYFIFAIGKSGKPYYKVLDQDKIKSWLETS